MSTNAPSTSILVAPNLEGLSYNDLISVLEGSELTGLSYTDLLTYLRQDLQLNGDTDLSPHSVGPTSLATGIVGGWYGAGSTAWTTTGTHTIALDTPCFTANGVNLVSNKIQIATAGYYQVSGMVNLYSADGPGSIQVSRQSSSGSVVETRLGSTAPNNSAVYSSLMECSAGDQLALQFLASVATNHTNASPDRNYLHVARVG